MSPPAASSPTHQNLTKPDLHFDEDRITSDTREEDRDPVHAPADRLRAAYSRHLTAPLTRIPLLDSLPKAQQGEAIPSRNAIAVTASSHHPRVGPAAVAILAPDCDSRIALSVDVVHQ